MTAKRALKLSFFQREHRDDPMSTLTNLIWPNMGLGVINLSLGFPTRSCSNKLAQLQKLARMLKLHMKHV